MKNKISVYLSIFIAIMFSNCARTDYYLKNTVSTFLLNNGKNYYFCIPIQYTGDYQIESFEFTNGTILIGNYELLLKRDELHIYVYLNENATDSADTSLEDFYAVYSEENGRVLTSKMSEPLTGKSDNIMNHYYFFIEKHLQDDDMKNIITEYKKGSIYSKLAIWYDITIENEKQNGNGMSDDFELYKGPYVDNTHFFQNLDFFRAKYLQ